MLEQARALALLDYDPTTGVLAWKGGRRVVYRKGEYARVFIDGKRYKAHRVIWLMMTGRFPIEIDHANGEPSDNSFSKLREATRSQNCANRRLFPNNKVRLKGVYELNGSYRVRITRNRKTMFLGVFKTREDAAAAYEDAARREFGDFARVA